MDFRGINYYHIPAQCEGCGGVMVFQGVGEYKCEKCGDIAYDDYGKVRLYIEQHRGATSAEIENGTGVTQRTIRRLLREERFDVAADSKVFLTCDVCGKSIRTGRFCPECEVNYHRGLEERERQRQRSKDKQGYSMEPRRGDKGQRRFNREDR